ncbi:MAG: CPBP family intramembrane metalloprotease [Chloroflexi bacterium]|nr:CPBP family intramembrane metalloprotease [Chloroflexota bacterium]
MKQETRKLVFFLVATFIWTWVCYTPIAVSGNSPYSMPWTILLILGGMGPSSVGVLMVLFSKDKDYRRDFWHRSFSFKRISGLWWIVIFLLFPILYGLSILSDVAMGGSLPGMIQLRSLIANPLMIPLAAFISFMSGPWSEEFGWRGYALDRILTPFGLLAGTISLGLLWGVWHLPLFFMPATWHGQIGFGLTGFWMFMLRSVGLALLMTWVYLNTSRSILSGMFMHFTSNFTGQLLASVSERVEVLETVFVFVVGLTACLLMVRKGRKETQADAPMPAH